MLEDEYTLYIYTDGSTYYHPRSSGVGIVFIYSNDQGEEVVAELNQTGYKGGTPIQMEIMACTLALIEARENPLYTKYRNVVIYSDSQFVVNFYLTAECTWSRNGWSLKSGAPAANVPLWKRFLSAKKKLNKPLEIKKVKAHSNNPMNTRADALAKSSAKLPGNKPPIPVQVARKFSNRYAQKGCIKIAGQVMWIHIIQRIYLHEHKIDYYRYEVMNKDSEYFGFVDYIFSDINLHRNYIYKVKVNDNQEFPRVEEVLEEVNRRDWKR